MRVRRTAEQDLEDTREELADARAKAAKWNGRVQELEEIVTEKENTLILRAVRSVAASPEDLRGLLDLIKGTAPPPPEPVVTETRRRRRTVDAPPVQEVQTEEPPENREAQNEE